MSVSPSTRLWNALFVACIVMGFMCAPAPAGELAGDGAAAMEQVQKYERSIHVMAMLLVGFGFLMVFVKRYGRSALTATYLLTALAVPLYVLLNSRGVFGAAQEHLAERLLLAEFAAASLLICAGAVLGRLRMWQYLVLGAMFVPCYMANEWVVSEGGLGLLPAGAFVDTGGSIIIHAFGAFFGLGAIMSLTTRKEFDSPVESDAASDRFSLLGSMVLWVFWPSFCAAMVSPSEVPHTALNVILALCGSTLFTYFATVALRRRISPADIANATLAGGVAIGSTCARPDFLDGAFIVGAGAGLLSTFGFAIIQPRLQNLIRKVDTCGVLYLHGLPGLLGGFVAVMFTSSPAVQLQGIGLTFAVALVAGLVAGRVLAILGRRRQAYTDAEELIVEPEAQEAQPEMSRT
jgi:ammonium transporter Rh